MRAGDIGLQVRCFTYLAIGARMQGDDDETRRQNQRAAESATLVKMQEYIAASRANDAWLSLRAGRLEDARAHAESALASWGKLALVFPFQWWAALPLLEIAVGTGNLERAAACAALLVSPAQQWFGSGHGRAVARRELVDTRGFQLGRGSRSSEL